MKTDEQKRAHAERMRRYYAENPEARERKRAADRARYQRTREERIEYQKGYYERNRERVKERIRGHMREKRTQRRAEAIERLGGRCLDCGFDNPAGLQFHHRDPAQKLFEVGGAGLTKPEAVFWAEVEKCDLLCGTCHLLRHDKD